MKEEIMETKSFVVQGRQTDLHKLLITPLRRERPGYAETASFQFLNEDHTVALRLPLKDVLNALDELAKDGAQLLSGYWSDDYLIIDWPKNEPGRDIVQTVAVRGAERAFSSRFLYSELRKAVYDAYMYAAHSA